MRAEVDGDARPGPRSSARVADAEFASGLFGALFEASPDGLLLIDDVGTVRAANTALTEMLRIEPERSIGLDVASFVPAVAAFVFCVDQGLVPPIRADEAAPSFAYDADGEAFPVEVTLTPVDAGDEWFTLALVRDLSVRTETALTLRNAAEDLRAARETHDTVIQQVFAAGMMLRAAEAMAQVPGVRERISTVTAGLDATISDLRDAIERLGGLDGDVPIADASPKAG